MRELHHPNIVNLHEAFWTDDQCLIVMDLARGGNLFDKLHDDIVNCRSDPFPGLGDKEFASKYVAGQLLEGIGYMQAHHVLHRDLKLENILITTTSFSAEEHCPLHHIKIADFGLSTSKEKKASSKPALRRTMTAVGTPDYVAPEVLLGKYDERVDYWSFGVILYAILCGRMPFFVSCLSPDEHKEQVSQVNSCPSWKRVSREGRNFVQGLLTVDPELRMDFSQCSEHPWLVGAVSSTCALLPPESPKTAIKVDSYAGVVESIVGRTGEGVHSVELWQRSGKVFHHGDGGAIQTVFQVDPDELLMAVMQDFCWRMSWEVHWCFTPAKHASWQSLAQRREQGAVLQHQQGGKSLGCSSMGTSWLEFSSRKWAKKALWNVFQVVWARQWTAVSSSCGMAQRIPTENREAT